MGKYFGTDGFRGKANVELTADHAYEVGRFLGWYYGREHRARIVVGKDTRRSSYVLEYAISAGMAASGADVYLLHVTTTPSVSYVTRTDGFDCGVMISASHNPYYDNGIKLLNREGEKMDEATIRLVEDYLDGHLEVDGNPVHKLPFAIRERIGDLSLYTQVQSVRAYQQRTFADTPENTFIRFDDKNTVSRIIKDLQENGTIKREGSARKGYWVVL